MRPQVRVLLQEGAFDFLREERFCEVDRQGMTLLEKHCGLAKIYYLWQLVLSLPEKVLGRVTSYFFLLSLPWAALTK